MVEITIHKSDSADYSGCGLGYLRPLDCTVSGGLNKMYSLDATVSLNDPMCEHIAIGAVIVAPVPAAETPEITRITGGTEAVTTWVYRVKTNGGNLHLRSGPGTNYKILRRYKNGTQITVLDRDNSSWYKVAAPDGAKGWMSSDWLAYVRTVTVGGAAGEKTVVSPKPVRAQPFRIYGIVPGLNVVTAKARHIFYDLSDNMVMPGKFSGTRQSIANGILKACEDPDHGFTALCDGEESGAIELTEPKSPVEAILGSEGLIESRGGELMCDWFDVYIVDRLGKNRGVSVRYGKNLKSVDGLIHSDNAATRIIPIGRDREGNDLYLPERYVEATSEQGLHDWPHPRYAVARVSDVDMGEGLSQSQACEKMRAHVRALFDNGAAMADASINVDFIDLNAVVSPEDADKLQRLFPGDDVYVRIDPMGITTHMRLVEYTYDCLRGRYRSATLGSAGQNIASVGISARQLPTAGITASKLANSAVGTKQLGDNAITSAKIRAAAIELAHIGEAAIDKLSAAAITALQGRFEQIAADSLTADELYAAFAEVVTLMVKSITAETIATDQLYAALADVILLRAQQINAENIAADKLAVQYAEIVGLLVENIDAEHIQTDTLGAALAKFVSLYAEVGEFDFATIKNLVSKALALEQGSMDTVYIKNLAATTANMLSATLGKLVIKGDDGKYYRVFVSSTGEISTEEVQLTEEEIQSGQTSGGQQITETNLNVGSLNAATIQGSSAVINEILTIALSAEKITAADALIASATIPALYTTSIKAIGDHLDLSANESVQIMVGEKNRIFRSEEPPEAAKVNDIWVQPSTGYVFQKSGDESMLPEFWHLVRDSGLENGIADARDDLENKLSGTYSELTQTVDSLEFAVKNKVDADELQAYMRYSDGTLELGKKGSRYTTQTSENGFVVLQDGEVMTSMKQNTVSAPVVEARRMLTIGGYSVFTGATGHLIFN